MSKQQAWILIVIAAVAVGALVHMNRYEFLGRTMSGYPYLIRIDHLMGQPCVASVPGGWEDYEYEEFLEVVNMPLC